MVQNLTRQAQVFGYVVVHIPEGTLASPSGPQSSSLEGPPLSRDRLPLGADCANFFPQCWAWRHGSLAACSGGISV